MWMIELATNTSTAESRIGSQSDKSAVMTIYSAERLDPGDRTPEDQRMDVVRAFVSVNHLKVDDVADHAELVRDAVAAEHVACDARDVERLAAGVALHDRRDLDRRGAFVLHARQEQ